MPLPRERTYTIDDIYALPDGERAELIDGQIYYMAPPSRKHQDIIGELFATIRDHIHSNNGASRAYIAPFAVFLNENGKNYAEPDICVICDQNKLNDKGCAGVREYWIVDPDKDRITVYHFEADDMNEYSFTDDVPVGIYPSFSINLLKLNI